MRVIKIPAPNAKQKLFFASRKRYIGYGGARGGGKSWAMRVKGVLLCFRYKGLKVLLLRKTLPELRNNHIIPLQALLQGVCKYNKDERAFLFPNGSRFAMGYCAADKDVFQYQGVEYDVIMFEECTHFPWDWVVFILTCNRNTRDDFSPRAYFTGNPGGVGHRWFKRLFVKGQYTEDENPEDYDYIPATLYDNTVLMRKNPEYEKTLLSLPEQLKQAHLYGNWDIFEGQFFEDFRDVNTDDNYNTHLWTHVINAFEVPETWKIYRSFDWGYSKPFACSWWAMDNDGRIYGILELYGCTKEPNTGVKWEPNKVFEEIRRVEEEHRWLKGKKILGVADPSIWDKQHGESIADTAEKHRVYFDKGDNKRIPGWMQMHYRFAFDEEGYPMIYFFKETCPGMIRTVPELQYSSTIVEDLDTSGEDHLADEARYLCMLNPIPPRKTEFKPVQPLNPLDDNDKKYDRYGFYRM